MTYRELKEQIEKFDDEQLDCEVTTYSTQENSYYPVVCLDPSDDGRLGENHPCLLIADEIVTM